MRFIPYRILRPVTPWVETVRELRSQGLLKVVDTYEHSATTKRKAPKMTTTTDLSHNMSREITSPYADAQYAFGRVRVTYVEYVAADDAFATMDSTLPITSGYSAQLVCPSTLTSGKAAWDMVRGSGHTAVEATRNLLDLIDAILQKGA